MLHYDFKGKGDKTLVCLHGFLEASSMWSDLGLEKYARLILIDLPGHGKSTLDHIDSMQEMALAVKYVLEKERVSDYDVIGHSMGGYVGLELKQLDPKCERLILLNSNVWTDNKQKNSDRLRVAKLVQSKKERFVSEAIPNLFQAPEKHQEVVKALVTEASSMSSEAIGRASIAMSSRNDFTELVYSGELDVSIVQGAHDLVADMSRMEAIMIQHLERFHVIDSGHMAHIESREAVLEVLKEVFGSRSEL